MTPSSLTTSYPAFISLSCLIPGGCVSCPTIHLCAQLRNSCRGGKAAARCCWQRREGELLVICQDRSSAEKLYFNATVRMMWKKRYLNPLEGNPFTIGAWCFSNSALCNFCFHLELSFHSYPCNCILGKTCSFRRTCRSLATTQSWEGGPTPLLWDKSLENMRTSFQTQLLSVTVKLPLGLPDCPLTRQYKQTRVLCALSTYTVPFALGGHRALIAVRKASTETCHPPFQHVIKVGFLSSGWISETGEYQHQTVLGHGGRSWHTLVSYPPLLLTGPIKPSCSPISWACSVFKVKTLLL